MSERRFTTASGTPSVCPTCVGGDPAEREVDRPHPGVLGAPDVVEEPVADVDASRRVARRPSASIAAPNASGAGLVHGISEV